MKNIFLFLGMSILFSFSIYAADFDMGVFYGYRPVNNSDIRDVYGNGYVYFPYFTINIWKGLTIGGGYEGGYSREGKIGLYSESATLEVTGFEAFIGYQLDLKIVTPYAKMGYGMFSYKQTVESPFVKKFKVNHKKSTITVGVGLKICPIKSVFLAGEIKYVPLKVKPFGEEVDLGGLRYFFGMGLTFDF